MQIPNIQTMHRISESDMAFTIGEKIILKDCFTPSMGTVVYDQSDFVRMEDGFLYYNKKYAQHINLSKSKEERPASQLEITDDRPRISVTISVEDFCKIISPMIGPAHNKEYFNNSFEEMAKIIVENFAFNSKVSALEVYNLLLTDNEDKKQDYCEPTDASLKLGWVGKQNSLYCFFMLLYGKYGTAKQCISGNYKQTAGVIADVISFEKIRKPSFETVYNYMRKSAKPSECISKIKVDRISRAIKNSLMRS